MALGDNVNNQNKRNYSPVVYSQYRMSNTESVIDPTNLSTTFTNNMLKISIAPKKTTAGDNIEWDHENGISAFLTHTKARMLYNEIETFQANPNAYSNLGVVSGAGLISISNGKEFGINNPVLVIRKLDSSTGKVESSFAYEFKTEYNYYIRNFDESTADFDKIYDASLELEQIKTLLKTYYEAMTGATAYSVIDNMKYDTSRMNTKIDLISEKLGIEKATGGNYNNSNKSSNSIFNNKPARNFSQGTLDDIESQM